MADVVLMGSGMASWSEFLCQDRTPRRSENDRYVTRRPR